jgi:signal transduction histidine kinase
MNRALSFRRKLTVAGLAVLAMLFLAFQSAMESAARTNDLSRWVAHTQEVLGAIAQARLQRAHLENEMLVFQWTHRADLPALFQNDRQNLDAAIQRLQQLTSDNPAQHKLLAEIVTLAAAHVATLESTMRPDQPRTGLSVSGPPLVDSFHSDTAPARIRERFDSLEKNEQTLLAERTAAVQASVRRTREVLFIAGLLTFAILAGAGHLIYRDITARSQVESGLREAQKLLGTKYEAQASELGKVMEDLHGQIRARRMAEEALRELNEDLERRVSERTTQLQEMNAELEAFTYSVSHDLRAPLRHMDGFSRILQQEFGPQLPEEANHYLGRVRSAATHMSALVEDLLVLSRIGRHVPKRESVSLRALVEDVRAELRGETRDRQIEWKIHELPRVDADPILLRLVLVNLMGNAVKFTGGKQQAVIEVGRRQDGAETVFFVQDNGVGFDPQYADKLFGVFQRLHRQDEFEGTGIGLASVQRIIHKHGGRVWADSRPGQGAVFSFTLPGIAKHEMQIHESIGATV